MISQHRRCLAAKHTASQQSYREASQYTVPFLLHAEIKNVDHQVQLAYMVYIHV